MSTIEMGMVSWACRVRNFVVARDVTSDLAELTGVRHDHDDTVGQLIVDATAPDVIATQSCGQTTEVRWLRLARGERVLEPTVWTTRSIKLEVSSNDIAVVLLAFGVNDKSLATTDRALATTDRAMATVLSVLGLQFIVRGLASNFLEL
jgi:hypothetical protein